MDFLTINCIHSQSLYNDENRLHLVAMAMGSIEPLVVTSQLVYTAVLQKQAKLQ